MVAYRPEKDEKDRTRITSIVFDGDDHQVVPVGSRVGDHRQQTLQMWSLCYFDRYHLAFDEGAAWMWLCIEAHQSSMNEFGLQLGNNRNFRSQQHTMAVITGRRVQWEPSRGILYTCMYYLYRLYDASKCEYKERPKWRRSESQQIIQTRWPTYSNRSHHSQQPPESADLCMFEYSFPSCREYSDTHKFADGDKVAWQHLDWKVTVSFLKVVIYPLIELRIRPRMLFHHVCKKHKTYGWFFVHRSIEIVN